MSKPFDLEAAKAGAPVKTRSGIPVRLFCFDLKSGFPIGGAIELLPPEVEKLSDWMEDGSYRIGGCKHDLDLVMAPRKVVKWIAINSDKQGVNWTSSLLYDSEEELHIAWPQYAGIVARVEWEE